MEDQDVPCAFAGRGLRMQPSTNNPRGNTIGENWLCTVATGIKLSDLFDPTAVQFQHGLDVSEDGSILRDGIKVGELQKLPSGLYKLTVSDSIVSDKERLLSVLSACLNAQDNEARTTA